MKPLWPDDHADALGANIRAGLSFSQNAAAINAKFGTNYSRNSCIGKAKRLGLCQPAPKKELRVKRDAIEHRLERRQRTKDIRSRLYQPEPLPTPKIVDVVPLHLNLLDLDPGQCRFPYGDGPFTFCACPQFAGGPYCEPHLALTTGLDRGWSDERRHQQAGVARRSNNRKAA